MQAAYGGAQPLATGVQVSRAERAIPRWLDRQLGPWRHATIRSRQGAALCGLVSPIPEACDGFEITTDGNVPACRDDSGMGGRS